MIFEIGANKICIFTHSYRYYTHVGVVIYGIHSVWISEKPEAGGLTRNDPHRSQKYRIFGRTNVVEYGVRADEWSIDVHVRTHGYRQFCRPESLTVSRDSGTIACNVSATKTAGVPDTRLGRKETFELSPRSRSEKRFADRAGDSWLTVPAGCTVRRISNRIASFVYPTTHNGTAHSCPSEIVGAHTPHTHHQGLCKHTNRRRGTSHHVTIDRGRGDAGAPHNTPCIVSSTA